MLTKGQILRRAGRYMLTISVALMLLAGIVLVPGQQTAAKELTGAMSASWSPDGKQIAYAFSQQDHSAIYLFNVAEHSTTKLADKAGNPEWSPDGTRIAYIAEADGYSEINIITLATMQHLDLTMGYIAKWSPDGKQLAYGVGSALGIANADGSTPRHLITDIALKVFDFAWSPDGKTLAFATYEDDNSTQTLYVIAPDGSGQHKIATSTDQLSFAWSPDGSRLAVAGNCGGTGSGASGITAIACTIDKDGSNIQKLAGPGANTPSWSPDGKQIAFAINGGVMVVNADGSAKHDVTVPQPYIRDSLPLWSPDGSRLVFIRMQLPSTPETAQDPYMLRSQMYMANADGSNVQLLID